MADISEAGLVETFDKLVSEGVIVYGPHESVKLKDQGYPVSKGHTIEAKIFTHGIHSSSSASAQH